MFVYLFVCPFLKRVSGSSYIVENASNAALVPTSPEMKLLLQSSGIAAIFSHEAGSRGIQ